MGYSAESARSTLSKAMLSARCPGVRAVANEEIWYSVRAKEAIERLGWVQYGEFALKGFPGRFALWAANAR
jgi:hypothetical protein